MKTNGSGPVRENGDAVSWDELQALGPDGQPKTIRTYLVTSRRGPRQRPDDEEPASWEEVRATDADGEPKVVETYTVEAEVPVDVRVLTHGEWREMGLADHEGGLKSLPAETICAVLDRCLVNPRPPGGWTPERLDALDWAAPDDLVATVATRSRPPGRVNGRIGVDLRVASYGLVRRHGLLDKDAPAILALDTDQKAEFLDACVVAPRPPDGFTADVVENHMDWRSPDDLLLTVWLRSRSAYRLSIPTVRRVSEGEGKAEAVPS